MNKDFNLDTLVRENIKAMSAYSSARDEFTDFEDDMVFLDANENPFETKVNRYPDPQQLNLKTQLSSVKRVPINQILLGNGSDEVLDLIFRAFCEPNRDNIITLPPTYGMYKVLANTNAIENKEVLLVDDFQLDVNAILAEVDANTKLIFICSPNNPTGNAFDYDAIIEIIKTTDALVVLDEAYYAYSDRSFLPEISNFSNLVVLRTISKIGFAGLRLGLLIGSKETITQLNKLRLPYNINVLTQASANFLLQDKQGIVKNAEILIDERQRLFEELSFFSQLKVFPSQTNFLLVHCDDAQSLHSSLIENGILVKGFSLDSELSNFIRISVSEPIENNALLAAIKEYYG